jgi:hypothetical protein
VFSAARARADPARFCDVDYDRLVADPVGTVEGVYAHFGLPFGGAAADAVRALHAGSAAGGPGGGSGAGGHRYALADFGLTTGQVDERFAGYLRESAPPGAGGEG